MVVGRERGGGEVMVREAKQNGPLTHSLRLVHCSRLSLADTLLPPRLAASVVPGLRVAPLARASLLACSPGKSGRAEQGGASARESTGQEGVSWEIAREIKALRVRKTRPHRPRISRREGGRGKKAVMEARK